MGQKSIKKNKNIYILSRECAGLTREAAAEKMVWVSASKIEKIESEKQPADPPTVLAMARCYQDASLCNYYCSHDCEIGKVYVPKVEAKDLAKITLEVLAGINVLTKSKERLVEITVDGEITEDEIEDFAKIKENLEKMSRAVDALKLWVNNTIASGKLDPERFE